MSLNYIVCVCVCFVWYWLHMKCVLFHSVVNMDPQRGLVEATPPGNAHGETPKSFTFDAVYDWKYVSDLFFRFICQCS